ERIVGGRMHLKSRQCLALLCALNFVPLSALPARAADAGGHVVPLSELRRQALGAASERARNVADIGRVLSLPAAQQELANAGLKSEQVTTAISQLNDEELARLADRARGAEADVKAGFGVLSIF